MIPQVISGRTLQQLICFPCNTIVLSIALMAVFLRNLLQTGGSVLLGARILSVIHLNLGIFSCLTKANPTL